MIKKQVLGVNIDDINMDQALEIIQGWLEKSGPASPAKRGEKHYIVTTNPEFVMTAQTDLVFRKIINDADLSIPDGVGLKLSGQIKNTIPGVDLMEKLCERSAEKGFTIGLLGGMDQVAELTAERLKKKYPKLKVVFASEGRSLGISPSSKAASHAEDVRNAVVPSLPKADIFFVALGAPKQEFWMAENLPNLNVKVAMGVGGAFDFISGKVPRAPVWIRKIGLEWLFRLVIEPWRIKRQIKLFKYLWLVLH